MHSHTVRGFYNHSLLFLLRVLFCLADDFTWEAVVDTAQTACLKLAAAFGELALFECAGYHASVELMHVLRGEKVIRDCVQFHRFVESLRFLADLDRPHFSRLGYQHLFMQVYASCHEDVCPKAHAYTWLHKKVVFLEKVRDSHPPDKHELTKAMDFCRSANLAVVPSFFARPLHCGRAFLLRGSRWYTIRV